LKGLEKAPKTDKAKSKGKKKLTEKKKALGKRNRIWKGQEKYSNFWGGVPEAGKAIARTRVGTKKENPGEGKNSLTRKGGEKKVGKTGQRKRNTKYPEMGWPRYPEKI